MLEVEKINIKTIRWHTIPPRTGSRCPRPGQMRRRFQQTEKNSSQNIQQIRTVLRGPEKHREVGVDFGQSRPPQHHKTLLNNIDHQNSTFAIIQINLVMEYGGGNSLEQYIRNKPSGRLQ